MQRIRILPEILSNKIAAGEVVERPASVVKELLENSLDAGAGRVVVEIGQGGRELIRVADDGEGMEPDDAMLAIERYATSKIRTDDDLFSIRTLGFRGEALPSIASVSRMTLITRPREAKSGTRVYIEGGRVRDVSQAGAAAGTVIEVKNLFYNTPARRKFLKTVGTEMAHIADTVSAMALGWPQVGVELVHNSRELFSWPPARDPAVRAAAVLSMDVDKDLIAVSHADEHVAVSGWVAPPEAGRSTGRSLFVFVNGRLVKDRVANHAVTQGYAGRMPKGRYPVAVLFLEVPPDQVDVNVHPAKAQVRFAQQQKVHQAVARAVSLHLGQAARGAWTAPVPFSPEPGEAASSSAEPPARSFSRQGVAEAVRPFDAGHRASQHHVPASPERAVSQALGGSPPVNFQRPGARDTGQTVSPPVAPGVSPPQVQSELPLAQDDSPSLWPVAQVRECYILCESRDGLVIVDQHAAHERILFEKYLNQAKDNRVCTQALLFPHTFELSHAEAKTLEKLLEFLESRGLAIEPFGGRSFVIKAVPDFLAEKNVEPLIREIVEKTARIGASRGMDAALEEVVALVACHGAIRARQRLAHQEMVELLKDLEACQNPSQCPHGRPTRLEWSWPVIQKSFHRQ